MRVFDDAVRGARDPLPLGAKRGQIRVPLTLLGSNVVVPECTDAGAVRVSGMREAVLGAVREALLRRRPGRSTRSPCILRAFVLFS